VRPLEGGLDAWRERGFPVERVQAARAAAALRAERTVAE
jgi:3-mercaptopyruvate sulfurtransferase SseA